MAVVIQNDGGQVFVNHVYPDGFENKPVAKGFVRVETDNDLVWYCEQEEEDTSFIGGVKFKRVTADEWSQFCANYRCIGTEPTCDYLDHYVQVLVAEPSTTIPVRIARINYQEPKSYWIIEKDPLSTFTNADV